MTVEGEGIKTFEAISRTDHSASARAIFVLHHYHYYHYYHCYQCF